MLALIKELGMVIRPKSLVEGSSKKLAQLFAKRICPVNYAAFLQAAHKASTPVVALFWLPEGTSCRKMSAVLKVEAKKFPSIPFYSLHLEHNPEAIRELKVGGAPTCMIFRQGEVLSRTTGVMGKSETSQWLHRHLG